MNKSCYRLVFNKTRGLLMAVAETVTSQGKSRGESPATRGEASESPAAVTLRPLTFCLWAMLGMVAFSSAEAQIVADPNAPASQRPTVLRAPNNVPLVNLQTPGSAGVSRNTFSQFDVQQPGAILNNSRTNIQTQLGGWVQGNPWLSTGSARVILNEVNSTNASLLRGYLEVAGQRAQVVIANPAGVTCDGCGFINANRATLTTGTPLLNGGSLEGYRVQGGVINVIGSGMDASTTDYTDLIARAVQVNAGISANQLNVVAGANQVSVDPAKSEPLVSKPLAGVGAAPAFGIDVGVLGGMYAGKITLIGTQAGVGVNNAGKLYAGVGDVVVTADGRFDNAGQLSSAAHTRIDAGLGIHNSGTLYARGDTTLSTRGNVDNAGTIAAAGNTTLAATGTGSQITSTRTGVLGAGVQVDGSLGTVGNLTATATQGVSAQGQNVSPGQQTLSGQSINLSGSQTSARDLRATATGADILLSGATVEVGETLTVGARQTLRSDNARISAGQISASAHDISNVQGTLIQTGSGDLILTLPGALDNTAGRIATNSTNLTVTTGRFTNTDGSLEQAGTGALTITTPTLSGARGQIVSNGRLDLTTTSATFDAASVAAKQLTLRSNTLSNRGGSLSQTGSGAATLAASTLLDNTGGTIASNGDTALTVGGFNNQGGTLQAVGAAASNLTVNATGAIDNSQAGNLAASGNTTLSSDSLNNNLGQLTAGQALTATVTNGINNDHGLLASNRQISILAGQIDNSAGTIGAIQSDATITTTTGSLINRAGRIEAAQAASVAARGITNTDGIITGKSLHINSTAQAFDNARGQLIASGTDTAAALTLQTGALNNDHGLIQAYAALSVDTHGQTLTNTNAANRGGIVGQDTVSLRTGNLNNQSGYVGSGTALTIDGAAIANTQGGIVASGAQAVLTGSSLDNRGGQIQAMGNIDATLAGTLDNSASLVRSGQALTVGAGRVLNTNTPGSNQGLEGQSVSLTGSQIDNGQGAIRANNNVTLTSTGTVNNNQGVISASNALTVQDQTASKTLAVTNTGGTLIAGRTLVVDSSSLGGDGSLQSKGDMQVKLTQNYVHTGQFVANGTASLDTAGTLTNQSALQAGVALNLKAGTIDNQVSGTISAPTVTLQATDSHTLTNRGLIDGTDTVIETVTLNNLGTGRIYGDQVAIGATTVNNLAENSVAPVIAARNRLDIGAGTINNREHALIFSAVDMALGGSVDASRHAVGATSTLNNASATIEALGSVDINARQINNSNEHFSTTLASLPVQSITEYQGSGSPNRYVAGTPDVSIYNDQSDHLHTPEGNFESWSAYNYSRSTTETRLAGSDPAQILSGNAMRITADTLTNDKSRIIAGGALTGTIGTPRNVDGDGERIITDAGSVTSYYRLHLKGRDTTGSDTAGYNPAATIESITLTPAVYQQNTAPGGTGTHIAALSTTTVSQLPVAASGAAPAVRSGQLITPITQVALLTSSGAGGTATVVRSGGINTSVPSNRLFGVAPNPAAHYLVETDPAFASYRNWLTSDYLLDALSITLATIQKRLGDGFYEQKLIREQVAQLTGRRFLDGYADDEAQYQALMNNGVTTAKAQGLIPGVSLSAAQMAQLISDIVWLVEKDITLPNGTTTRALVPQLYVRVQKGDLQAGGALIAGNSVNLNVTGDLTNSGTIAGRTMVVLTAQNVHNLGGRILGDDVGVAARNDLNNIAGTIAANNSVTAIAGNDLNLISTTRSQNQPQGTRTNIDRLAGLYVTGSGGTLVAQAGRDINANAAVILNAAAGGVAGTTTLAAGNNLNLGTVTEGASNQIVWNGNNRRSDASRSDVGTAIQTQGDVTLQAGNDITAKAANILSTQGALLVAAGNNVNLNAGQTSQTVDEAHQHKGRSSAFSSTTTTTRDTLDATTASGSTLSGQTATVLANRDITITGSNVVSDRGTLLAAKNNLNIEAATNTTAEAHLKDDKKSGIFSSGGLSLTIGTQRQSADQKGTTTTAAASTIGSTQGNVNLSAGQAYQQVGSDVMAPAGDVNITAKKVDITEARETSTSNTETTFTQSGLTVAVTSPVISAIQTAQQMRQAAGNTSDTRMQVLAAGNVAMTASSAVDAVKAGQGSTINGKDSQRPTGTTNPDGTPETRDANAADKVGGVNISVSLGRSGSQSKTTQTSDTARQSSVTAGNNVNISATGAGLASDLLIQGTNVKAGNRVTLNADNDMQLLAAKNTADQRSTSSNQSGSLGISVGTDGLLLTASASGRRGKADGSDVSWTTTHIDAGNQVAMTSGGDTTLKGAVVTAPRITAQVGGNLNVESVQDTSQFASKQQSIGGSIAVGSGKVSGSISASKSKVDSTFASVGEQSGIQAGDGGFQITVKGNTDLQGGVITSTQKAIDDGVNRFVRGGTLTTSDIQNQASYSANSVGVSLGSGVDPNGKLTPGGTSAGIGRDSGTASSVTAAAISGIAGNQAARTGDAGTGIQKIFDADKVQKDINAQVQITQAFGREASTAIGDYAASQQKQAVGLREQASRESDPARVQALQQQAQALDDNWGANGALRVLAHTVVGGLTGGVNGAAGAAAGTLAAPLVAAQLQQAGIDGALAKTLTALASTAAGAAAGGVSGAGTALNEVTNNFLKHPEAAAFKRRLDGCEAQKGGCPDDQRKAIFGTYLEISGKNIQELQTCTMQADAACLNRIQTEIARSAELPASLVGNEASVFIGRQANAQDDVARAQIYVKDIAKARQTICGSLPTAACDQKLKVAKGDATEKAAGLVLAALGGGVVPEGVALVNAGANLVLRTGQLAAAEAKTLATMGPVLYCAQLGSGGGCAAIVDAAMQIASGVVSPLSVVPVVAGAGAGAKTVQVVEGEVVGAARAVQGAESGVWLR